MNFYLVAFLTIPIIAIVGNLSGKLKSSLWWSFVLFIPIGWVLIALSHISYQNYLDELVRSTPNPPNKLLDEWQNDGAANIFSFYFGWLVSIAYFFVCYVVLKGGRGIINRIREPHGS